MATLPAPRDTRANDFHQLRRTLLRPHFEKIIAEIGFPIERNETTLTHPAFDYHSDLTAAAWLGYCLALGALE